MASSSLTPQQSALPPEQTVASHEAVNLTAAEVGDLVEDLYGVRGARVTPLGAESSAVCRVDERDGGSLAVKVFWADDPTGAAARWQHEVVDRLSRQGLPVARPKRSRADSLTAEGATRSRSVLVQVSEWLTGAPLEEVPFSKELLRSVGRTAARLQTALGREQAPTGLVGHDWEITAAATTIERSMERIRARRMLSQSAPPLSAPAERLERVAERVIDLMQAEVEPRLGAIPRAVVHHDLHDSNLLVDRSSPHEITGILDFGDMLTSIRISEPVIAAAYAARNTDDPVAAVSTVLRGWAESYPISAEEDAVVLPLAAARLATNAAVWTSRLTGARAAYAAARLHGSLETAELLLRAAEERWSSGTSP
ncbi:phosphotransferase [Herbiconiux sp. KACC 21604]|uniref:phosphotransferase n=1 Tax=unclassified Herbiconiux TaxID=2618217 RepID=UPI00149305D5|nr:phosphotransferase [Herbiconiux sp. SALV-R1]QJU53458.1 phosphotransferase [Herbiconiux sp. SALV-R1]WPO88429.1 phosphotransferase [Herbiconiux sp. KACC 21604]